MKSKNLGADVGSILMFGAGVFCLVSLVTYSPLDPSFLNNATEVVSNACGWVGSHLAAGLLGVLGLAAYLMPWALFVFALALHKGEDKARLLGVLAGLGIAVMALTMFLALQWKFWPLGGGLILTGGVFGTWMTGILTRYFSIFGGSLISMLVFLLAIALSTPISVAKILGWVMAKSGVYGWKLLKLSATGLVLGASYGIMHLSRALSQGIRDAFEYRRAWKEKKIVSEPLSITDAKEALPEEPAVAERISLEPTLRPTEAPNALPELEKPRQLEMGLANTPEILPLAPVTASAASAPKSKISPFRSTKKGQWQLPLLEFLSKAPKIESAVDKEKLLENSKILKQKFADFGIDGEVTAVRPGPVITLYEFKPGPGVKVSRIAALADDLSMALSAQSVRILAPLPGKSVVGIEIPSDVRQTIYLREFLEQADFKSDKNILPVVMGKDISGQPYLSDLARMPHLLCAGQTGSGKSVFMNGLICSLLYRFTPDELRMILVDPKFIEFRSYQDIPHLLLPVVDDPKQAATALKWAVREMERRYRILAMMGVRNLAAYNQRVEELGIEATSDILNSEENKSDQFLQMSGSDWLQAFEPDESGEPRVGKLPYIVVIIDELADLMMIAKKEVEISIARVAQKARAAGIHLIIATQRPSTDVVTGLIKANLPSRVSFSLASYVDSKTILDRAGAERLLGQGDMLFTPPGTSQIVRLHGAYLKDNEIEKITAFWRSQGKPAYRNEILVDDEDEDSFEEGEDADDPLFPDALDLVRRSGHASASSLQRHFKVGYNRAARMIETMESRGIVGPADGARPREVLLR